MENKEIIEGNKLIAEFMGAVYHDCYKNSIYPNGVSIWKYDAPPKEHCTVLWNTPNMEYHTSWDWLMPVIDKITEIDITPAPNWSGYRIEIVPRGYVKISGFPMTPSISANVSIEGSLINATFKAVVEFIKWYNENNTNGK